MEQNEGEEARENEEQTEEQVVEEVEGRRQQDKKRWHTRGRRIE